MRPIRVEMEGFSTFRDTTTVEFDAFDLVAFVGPTGSGKSSIIDAITFALYGSVARYDDVRLVAPVITQNATEAKVRLDFDVADRRYTAVRIVRRTKTGATTKEARLERHMPNGSDSSAEASEPNDVLASGAKELTTAVEDLLGLDFVQFTRTVVLPQGEFAEFLKDDPASRQKLLTRLLDLQMYGRMGAKARERAKAAGHRAAAIAEQLERHDGVNAERLAERRGALEALVAFSAEADERLGAIVALDAKLTELRDDRRRLVDELERLQAVAVPPDVAEAGPRLAEAKALVATRRTALEAARAARDDVAKVVAEAGDPAALKAVIEAAERLAALDAELIQLGEQQSAAEKVSTEAAERLAAATAAHDDANTVLVAARRSADAGQWVAALVEGDACPVCRQVVDTIPDHDPDAELARAADAEAGARSALADAKGAADAAVTSVARLKAMVDDRTEQRSKSAERVRSESPAELAALLSAAIEAAERQRAVADDLRRVETEHDAATGELERLDAVEQRQRVEFARSRDGVATMSPPELSGDDLLVEWTALATWAADAVTVRADRSEAITIEGKELRSQRDELTAALAASAAPFGLELDDIVADLGDELVRAQTDLRTEVVRLETTLAEVAELAGERKARDEEKSVYDLLGRQLSASGFEQWLLSEAIDDLVARATEVLRDLSNGQFSLTSDDRAFRIIDHRNADLERDVRTLSGGETFLASLALALALSDSIAELAPIDSPRLGSMFLDEGFGTLDPETLDTVATAIEELSASGRLVGIVTHIEALAERMPVRYVVNKGSDTSTVKQVLV